MKKFLTVLLVGCVAMSMTACDGENTATTAATTIETTAAETTATETTDDTTAAATTEAETNATSAASEIELNAGQTNTTDADFDVSAILIPESAAAVTVIDGIITMTSTDTFEDLTVFYKEAVETLGAEGKEADASTAQDLLGDIALLGDEVDAWTWIGTYEDGKDLTIAVISIAGTNSITIQY